MVQNTIVNNNTYIRLSYSEKLSIYSTCTIRSNGKNMPLGTVCQSNRRDPYGINSYLENTALILLYALWYTYTTDNSMTTVYDILYIIIFIYDIFLLTTFV